MPSSDFITSSPRKLRIKDVETEKPNSESVNQKIGGSVNFLLDRSFFDIKMNFSGYFNNNAFDNGSAGIEVIERDCVISRYYMSIYKTGSSGINGVNVAVYDSTGAFVNNIFGIGGNALQVTGSNGTNVIVGKTGLDTVTPTNVLTNTAGHTVQTGNIQLTDFKLLQGYVLVPFITGNGANALNLNLSLRLKEI